MPPSAAGLLTEWNHWWPYEDAEIDEETFLAEASVAADLGLEVAVLDAGWFGRPEASSDWVAERGDWHRVNTARFPHGLAWLAEETRRRGIDFGIWIEAEAIGPGATVAAEHPEIVARTADGSLGYVCLGSPAGRTHVHDHVARLIAETGARWIKWDFNLDPGSGCRRGDHGHDADDGLLRHYLGLYAVLDRLRAAHPDTIFEACSSGGLRIDAGLAAHVDGFFLSDPDWTEHHLTCLWGAARLLPPRQLLHWPQSEWRGEHRFQKVDYSGTLITTEPVRHQDQGCDAAPVRHLDPADPAAGRPARAAPPSPAGVRGVRPTAAGRRDPPAPDGSAAARGEGTPTARRTS